MSNSKSESKIQESDGEMELPEEFLIAHRNIQSKIEYLVGYHRIQLPPKYQNRKSILLMQYFATDSLDEYIAGQHNRLGRDHQGVNGDNLISRRDAWLSFVFDAMIVSIIFADHNLINKAWNCLNIASYHIARVEVITEIDMRIQLNISKAKKFKSKEAISRQTIKEKKLLIDLFFKNSPDLGWKSLKIAMHQIEPHLIKVLKTQNPNDTPQEVKKASEELLEKLGSWMRTDENFKTQIYRHIQNKIVPDLTKL